MPKGTLPRDCLEWRPDGRRGQGSPRESYKRTMETEIQQDGITLNEAKWIAQDGLEWREFVTAL